MSSTDSADVKSSKSAERKMKALARLDDQIEKTKLKTTEKSGWDDDEADGDLDFADLEITFDEAIEL